jgi:hypothetical protein
MSSKDKPRIEIVKPMAEQKKKPEKKKQDPPEIKEIRVAGNPQKVHGTFDKTQKIDIVEIGRPGVDK